MILPIMADEDDEVDILGDTDYNLDNLLGKDDGRLGSCYVGGVLGPQGTELLNCDYNIGSHWLLDTPNHSCWYTSTDDSKTFERSQFGFSNTLPSGVPDSLPSTSHWDDNDSWTDKEKSLLEQGLDIFGQSWTQLAQFIGTKTMQQVKKYVTSQNIQFSHPSENFTLDLPGHCNSEVFNFSELIDDIQIPASMEEVIAVVSTAQPTVPSLSKKNNSLSCAVSRDNNYSERGKRKEVHDSKLKNRRGRPSVSKHCIDRKGLKTSSLTSKRNKYEQIPSSVIKLSSGEEVIRIKKESSFDSDEDAEIEIEDDAFQEKENIGEEEEPLDISPKESIKNTVLENKIAQESEIPISKHATGTGNMSTGNYENGTTERKVDSQLEDNLKTTHSHNDVLETIFSMPAPKNEVFLDSDVITDDERAVHFEFFEGRSAKTPKRYLKIRNHILECWRQSRPLYITKTSVRTGLKHCGDVNCIGRIHAYLEQIGAINFGCEQARYLNSAAQTIPVVATQKKMSKDELAAMQQARIGAMRPRKKKQHPSFILDGDGGYTITHSESGEAIHTTVVQDLAPKGQKGHSTKTKSIKLIYCHKYTESKPAPFVVHMNIEALLVVDLHAHSSHTEVAGLLGGTYDFDNGVLQIRRALACRSNSSGVHCDMCPVSQTEASEKLQHDGLEVVGWYHSHPTFLPNPSLQDLTTQSSIQQWFSQTTASPIVSFILAPYCPINPSLASQYRCLTVHTEEIETSPCGTPYMFPVVITSHGLNISNMVKDMAAIFSLVEENQQVAVNFDAEFLQNPTVSYRQKCVESAKLHLASCKPSIPYALQNSAVQSITQACSTLALARGDTHRRNDD